MTLDYDVVVVGAGPAGAATATLLARRGHTVGLVDRASFPRPKACAEYMSPGVREVLTAIGMEHVLDGAGSLSVPGMTIVAPRGARLQVSYERDGRPVMASTLPRFEFDARLVECAVSSGVELVDGCVVREPVVRGGRVVGVRGNRAGEAVELTARLTIAADGSHSVLARQAGLASAPRWPVRLGLVAHFSRSTALADGFGEMHVDSDGYCGVAPLAYGLLNVSIVVRADALRRSQLSATTYMERWIGAHDPVRNLLSNAERVTSVRGVLPIGARTRHAGVPGMLLGGDAAGFFDPFTGEGIYRALRSAALIDWLVSESGVDGIGALQLRRYERMRAIEFRAKEAVTSLVQLFVSRPALLEYALPRLANRPAARLPLCASLGDIGPASRFLDPRTMWTALRP